MMRNSTSVPRCFQGVKDEVSMHFDGWEQKVDKLCHVSLSVNKYQNVTKTQ